MAYTLKLLKRAEDELHHSCEWYDSQKRGLARQFLKELDLQFKFIVKNPELYQIQGQGNLRFSPLKKFPFVVIYWFDEGMKIIYVVSIFHTSREPII
ncbi:type II toxin-antitoxin system RelE/ParE family toxin [Sphingobacterium detergens]|uniref:ParE-like toxin of type II ParDE toxin-antitoxin system n=1 Tax=Sphingobacterium detergens TaxID=1145106 RepID=A0A420AYJ1_SPHD1|nr:type II toxin-antitoxin system RelE/ParE family toxin [Sphingobacterium detergens]RKE49525.1 ParE-like toxin of type II ParDE toxin-antitoxin system [Sphingobacterium detergens]